ncbi:MAG: AAA family ATPase [Lachnospiraceae bacterium]|nr:AAA family ATPase [Lachnospiraceae bacterium]
MADIRVVIIDTDENYINPFHNKLLLEYWGLINVEIITDIDYFNKFFSYPQKIDLLIIEESLFIDNLKKHDIDSIVILTEKRNQEGKDNVSFLYKYSKTNELFAELEGRCNLSSKLSNLNERNTQVIVFSSANGGAGKTTVSMGVSAYLSSIGKKVLYINSGYLQNFDFILRESKCILDNEAYITFNKPKQITFSFLNKYIEKSTFDYWPAFKLPLISLGLDYSVYQIIIDVIKEQNEYDYIIVDTDSCFDNNKMELIGKADKTVFVINQSKASYDATNIMMKSIGNINSVNTFFVCNNCIKDERVTNNRFEISEIVEKIENLESDEVNPLELLMRDGYIKNISFLLM